MGGARMAAAKRQVRTGGRSARVMAAVIEATLECLLESGYAHLSIGAVAKRAGVHETSIYRRWSTKGALVADAVTRTMDGAVAVADTGSFAGDARATLEDVRQFLRTPMGRAILEVASSQAEELAELRRSYWESRRAAVAAIVSRAKARGEVHANVDAHFVFDLCTGPILLRLLATGDVGERFIDAVVDAATAALVQPTR